MRVQTKNVLQSFSRVALLGVIGCAHGGGASLTTSGLGTDDAGPPSSEDNDAGPGAEEDASGGTALIDASEPTGRPDAAGAHTVDSGADSSVGHSADAAIDSAPPVDSSVGGSDDSGGLVYDDAGVIPALIGKWTFDEGTGTTSADLSGNGHTATLVGGASWATAGKEGAGLALDGATGYVDVGVSLIDTAQSFSVLSWVKLTVVNSWEVVLSQDDVEGSLFGLKLRGDGSDEFDFDVETSDTVNPPFIVAQSTATATASAWVHLAGVYDATGAGTLTVYVDGLPRPPTSIGQSVMASTGHFVIGRGLYNDVTGSFVNGVIDDVEVHSVALTQAQVDAIYESQAN